MADETFLQKVMSYDRSDRVNEFRNGIRGRDDKCTVSGTINRNVPITWSGFEVAHFFLVEQESVWIDIYLRT